MVKFKQTGFKAILLSMSLTVLSGCSTIDGGVDSFGQGLVYVGDKLQLLTGSVEAKKVDDKKFQLIEFYHEPVTTFDSWSLRAKAREVCPEGYVYESRQAIKAGEFPTSHNQCEDELSCGYVLEWRIKCEEVPYEPFSLFGKT